MVRATCARLPSQQPDYTDRPSPLPAAVFSTMDRTMHTSTKRKIIASLAMMLVATLAIPAPAQEVSLPGGAANLRETHGNWTVACAVIAEPEGRRQKLCALSQEQVQSQTRQRALTIELRPEGEGVKGALVLPFGLALGAGVTYQLDEGETGAPRHFRTCLPAGCLIEVAFDAGTVANLKAGDALKIKATADGGQEMAFSVSLTGFSSAYDRVVELMR